jgi:hypothetical protein
MEYYQQVLEKILKIEGNHLILMQNLRNFTVQFELLENQEFQFKMRFFIKEILNGKASRCCWSLCYN